MFERLKGFCDSLLERGLPGFDLTVYKDGECVLRHMNGYNDLENKIEINGKEKYNIYSCSKIITCTAALQLWEKGMFSLEDKLSDYMPEFKEMTVKTENGVKKAENDILIKHLFGMTAGFSYETASPMLVKCKEETEGRCPTRETMKYLAKEPLLSEPGAVWRYGLCHDVLAALVEVISGEKFEDYVKKNIFDVLGMEDSTFLLDDSKLDTVALQYNYRGGEVVNAGKKIHSYKLGSEFASGGAGCISTSEDYMKFLEGLRTFRLLKPDTVKEMITDRGDWASNIHGYGLGVRCPKGVKPYEDFGWGGAACAFAAVDLTNAISVYFAAHQLNSPVQGFRSVLYRLTRAEIMDNADFENIKKELERLYNYTLTY